MSAHLTPRELLPEKSSTALLIIDVQERLAAAMPGEVAGRVIRNTSILLHCAQEFSIPVLVSEQYPRGLGPTVAEIKALLPAETIPAEKTVFSCCAAPSFQPLLAQLSQRSVILCGIETHVCVLQTALDLLEAGWRVYIAADAAGSRTKQNWRMGLDLMRRAGAVIGSTEIFAFALLGGAGTDPFKRISQLVK
jgi:nicotinamidase-related amidase